MYIPSIKSITRSCTQLSSFFLPLLLISAFLLASGTAAYAEEKTADTPAAVTTNEPDIPLDQFELRLNYLTADQLFTEADGWLKLLQAAAKDVYDKKLEIKQLISQSKKMAEKNATSQTAEMAQKDQDALTDELTQLIERRKKKEEKLNAVLNEIDERIGLDDKGRELAKVKPYRRYLHSVSGFSQEISDPKTFLKTAKAWFFSKDGGILWLINIFKFMSIILIAWFISKLLSNAVSKGLAYSNNRSKLLSDFIVNIVKKLVMLIGVLMALAVLGVNMGPVLAFVGAAGFVVAFALQNTLSNFASGLMIMLYRPFDIGDVVDVAGVIGTVKSMTLVTTSIMTADNRMMIIPNNTIWGSIITNVTHSDKRRVDLTIGIGYNESIDKAQKVLEDILSKHPLILKDPVPTVQVNELADSSVNFIVRPWTLTADYWTVYWEITRRIKVRFDEEGISIPFPQRDIHIVSSVETEAASQKKRAFTKKKADEIDVTEMESGDEDDA